MLEMRAGENICLYVSGGQAVRGSLFACADDAPMYSNELEAMVCWLDSERTLAEGNAYLLRINGMEMSCTITEVLYKTDVHTFEQYSNGSDVVVNEFAKVQIKTDGKVAYDLFNTLAENGRGILIDEKTNYTAGAFVVA